MSAKPLSDEELASLCEWLVMGVGDFAADDVRRLFVTIDKLKEDLAVERESGGEGVELVIELKARAEAAEKQCAAMREEAADEIARLTRINDGLHDDYDRCESERNDARAEIASLEDRMAELEFIVKRAAGPMQRENERQRELLKEQARRSVETKRENAKLREAVKKLRVCAREANEVACAELCDQNQHVKECLEVRDVLAETAELVG